MLNITSTEIKTTKNGVEYKQLLLDTGEKINMWKDDPDYNFTSTELDRELHQENGYTNLKPKSIKATVEKNTNDIELIHQKLNAIYWVLQEIAKANGLKTMQDLRTEGFNYPDTEVGEIPF